MKLKKGFKRMVSMLLAAVMCMAMCLTGFAADDYTITVNNAATGETYSAYKIFDVTYSGDNYSYTIDSGSAWFSIVNNSTLFTLTQISGSDTYSVTFISTGNDTEDKAAIAALFKEVPSGAVAAASAIAQSNTVTLDVTSSGAGYYFVTTSLGSLVMISTAAPNAIINEKNSTPTITKYEKDKTYDVDWTGDGKGEYDTSGNGDTMQYRLIIKPVNDVTDLVIHDYLDSQLVLTSLEITSIKIYSSSTDTEGSNVSDTKYSYKTGDCSNSDNAGMSGCSFEISIDDSVLAGLSAEAYLEIIYEVKIDESSASFDANLEDEIDNTANVTFGAAGVGTPSKVETMSFGFQVYKYTLAEDDNGDPTKTPLAGASFVLKQTETTEVEGQPMTTTKYAKLTKVDLSTVDVYMLDSWVDSIEDATKITTGSTGYFTIEGLHDGTYYLEETAAPAGYNQLGGDVTVIIGADGSVTVDETAASDKIVNVENNSGSQLPSTGGMGTTLFYVIGGLLVLIGAAFVVTKMRLGKTE